VRQRREKLGRLGHEEQMMFLGEQLSWPDCCECEVVDDDVVVDDG